MANTQQVDTSPSAYMNITYTKNLSVWHVSSMWLHLSQHACDKPMIQLH